MMVQDFHSIYDTPIVKGDDGEGWKDHLRATVLFLVLSPNSNHQQDMLFRVAEYKQLEEIPVYKVCDDVGCPCAPSDDLDGHILSH